MTTTTPPASFADLGVRPEMLDALARQQIEVPTEVQSEAWPRVLSGQDWIVQSRTGSGKTLAFMLPLLQGLTGEGSGVEVLVVVPTRELAHQVAAVAGKMGRTIGVSVATLTGGEAYRDQGRALDRGARIVVGTPGRLLDHLNRGSLDLSGCRTVVLDEADEILDMGFQEDLEKLLGALPVKRQTLLFSATFDERVERVASGYMRSPGRLALSSGVAASTTLVHQVLEVHANQKVECLVNWLHVTQPTLVVVFCHTKATTAEVASRLSREGFRAAHLSGDLAQAARHSTLEAFRRREVPILVATDVAARGIDVRGISHVVNLDMPRGAETYVHRSGRTGRAGQDGIVVNLVTPHDRSKIRNLEREGNLRFERHDLPSAARVAEVSRQRLFQDLAIRIEADEPGSFRELARELTANLDAEGVVACLLEDWHTATGRLSLGHEVASPSMDRRDRPGRKPMSREGEFAPRPRREGAESRPERPGRGRWAAEGDQGRPAREPRRQGARTVEEGMSRIRLDMGKFEVKGPGHLVRVICEGASIPGSAVGMIALQPKQCWIDVKSEVADRVVQALGKHVDEKGRTWSARQI